MLTADEYHALYYHKDKRVFQLAKHYLSKWGIIENNASQLDEDYNEIAYLLFSALNEMTEEERAFLANKYRTPTFYQENRSDKKMADEYDLTLKEYRALRKGVERKFYHYLNKIKQEHETGIVPDTQKKIQNDWLHIQLHDIYEYLGQYKAKHQYN